MGFDQARIIGCESIYNFRDYGGYAVPGGGRLRSGMLFRSGQHGEASDADLDRVSTLTLRTAVDLRGASERSHLPCRRHDGFAAEVISVAEETVDPALITARQTSSPTAEPSTAEQARMMMRQMYRVVPFSPPIIQLYSRYFRTLAAGNGSSLIYCMAGKDRTGLAVWLLHRLAGVHADDAMQDYLHSNLMPGRDEWIDRTRERYRHAGVLPTSTDALHVLLSVEPDFLSAGLKAIEEQAGGVDRYMERILGVDDAQREVIRAQIIA